MALVSTFTGAPSTSGSPANLSSKTSDISMESLTEEGTLHHLADQLKVRSLFLSRMSPSPTQVSEMFPSLSGWTMSHCTDIQSLVSSVSSSTQCSGLISPARLPASQLREPETRGERREEETPGRRGPTRRWQGSATLDRSLRVGTLVLPSPPSPS